MCFTMSELFGRNFCVGDSDPERVVVREGKAGSLRLRSGQALTGPSALFGMTRMTRGWSGD
jgi:hypothetical protein